ncbi:MAG: 3D domain-containing protein [Oscillospiraceae bacterium]|nr:3D domain-containing protein [Oscillospiraceae bacterium]
MIVKFQNRKKGGSIAAVSLSLAIMLNVFWAFADSYSDEFIVYVLHDGKRSVCRTTGGTVYSVLKEAGIEIGNLDVVEPRLGYTIRSDETITITRRELVTREESEVIPPQTVETPTSLLKEGIRRTLSEGIPGLRVTTYEQMHEEGEPIEDEKIVSTELVTKPLAGHVLMGTPGAAISPFEFDVPLDENGIPQSYKSVMNGTRASGYSARPGAKTASGRPAIVGHVAVNPSVIPYGTRLYIRSADGNFVYGYAIAADTGTALKRGIVAVDLFYNTHTESMLNEIRIVDIYILE